MSCSFISKKGLKCKNNSISESNFCHIKSHYLTTSDYTKIIEKKKKNGLMKLIQFYYFQNTMFLKMAGVFLILLELHF